MRFEIHLVGLRHELHLVAQRVEHTENQAEARGGLASLDFGQPLARDPRGRGGLSLGQSETLTGAAQSNTDLVGPSLGLSPTTSPGRRTG